MYDEYEKKINAQRFLIDTQKAVIAKLEAEIKRLKEGKYKCPCGGIFAAMGISIHDKREVWECTKCKTQILCFKP